MVFGSLILLAAATVVHSLRVCVVVSAFTPSVFLLQFAPRLAFHFSAINIQVIEVKPWQFLSGEEVQPCSLVLDATADCRAAAELQQTCQEMGKGLLSLSLTQKVAPRPRLDIHIDPVYLLPYFEGTMRHFNWTSLSLLYSPDAFGTALRDRVSALFTNTKDLIAASESEENLKVLISKRVRKQGSSLIVVGTTAEVVPRLFATLKEAKMMREGYGYIVIGDAVWGIGRQWPGLLLLKEADCAFADTEYQCDADRTAGIIRSLSAAVRTQVEGLEAEAFSEFFNASSLIHAISISAINVRNSALETVGSFTSAHSFVQTETIYFPGNQTTLHQLPKSAVEVSFNSGLENPSIAPTTVAATFYRGQQLAQKHINQRSDILPHHNLVTNEVAFGAAQWNETWARPRILENRDRLGVAYMSGYASAVTMNTLLAFNKLNLSRPVISSSNSLIALGNSTAFPWFVRNGVSDLYFAALFSNIMPVMGWKRCAVLYGDDVWGTSVYAKFRELAVARKIEILNNETLRRVPGLGSKQLYWEACQQQLLELFRCNARFVIIFLLEPVPQYILELMFDLGARKGDFIFSGAWLASSYVTKGTAANIMKHKELLEGTVGFTGSAWIGSVGSSVKSAFLTDLNDTDPAPFACYYYDSVFAIAHAIDTCEQLGFDYEDPHRLMRFLRETRFVGCSGFVSWSSGENNRAYVNYNILNFVRNKTTGVYSLNTVGTYSPTTAVLFNFSVPLKFADGTSVPPSDLRVVLQNCPFEEKHRQVFESGRKLSVGICSAAFLVTALLTLLIYKKAWSNVVPKMKRSELSMEDVLFMGTIGVEAVQIACIGPDFRSLNEVLMLLAQLVTVDLSDVITFSKGVYWVALDTVLATVGLWAFLNVFTAFRLEERWRRFGVVRLISSVAYYLLPILGSVCFVPIIFILLDVFICEEAIGTPPLSFAQSILFRDCYEHCWRGTHIMYVVLACVSMVVYIPSAILLRPVWQDYQNNLHIRAYPLAVALKSLVQVALICLSKTVKRWGATGFGVACVSIEFAFFACSCRVRAFNYNRANLWHCVSLLGATALSLVALLNGTLVQDARVYLLAAVGGVWVMLVIVGLWAQHRYLPSLLYRRKGRDFGTLIRFAFTNSVRAEDVKPQLNYARRSDVELSDISINISSQYSVALRCWRTCILIWLSNEC